MDSSHQQLPPSQQIKYQTLPLSKKNLLLLLQNKKSKICKNYIAELSNQNPKAQKIIKQVLQQIFCQKKTPSATAYFYALVFYKNLLISSQLDYYEDPDFFPFEIHQAIAQICSYNEKENNIKAKGKDYFSYCVKIQANQNNKENLESLGNSVVSFAMEILQTMAELYKVDYFSGDLNKPQQSHFYTHYHMYKKRGIIFPNKQDYLYLKQNDVKEFKLKYAQFTAEQQADNLQGKIQQENQKKQQQKESKLVQNPASSPVKKSQTNQQPLNISNLGYNKPQQLPKKALYMDPKSLGYSQKLAQLPQKQLQSKIKGQANSNNQSSKVSQSKPLQIEKPSSNIKNTQDNYSRQSKIQISLSKQIDELKNTNLNSEQRQSRIDISKLGYGKDTAQGNTNQTKNLLAKINQSKLDENQLQNKVPIKKQEVNRSIIQEQKKKQENKNSSTSKLPQTEKNTTKMGNLVTKRQGHVRLKIFEARPNSKRQTSNSKMNQTAIIQATQSLEKQKQNSVGQRTHFKIQKSQKSSSNLKSKLTINQIPKESQRLSVQQLSTSKHVNEHALDSNISFSPGLIQRMAIMRGKIKSVPKTQKKFLQNTFHQNSQLGLKLGFNENLLSKTKKGIQKVPTKTLSSWRYDKNNKKDLFCDDAYKKKSLIYTIKKLKYPQLTIPLIPQYFAPVTLKMYGLRRSALQVSNYSQSSQVFFNNKIIEARLMKPSQGYYVLSLLNISRSTLNLSALNMSGIQYSRNVNILGGSITQNTKKALHSGNYMDIKFTFKTIDLNFKFLPFRVEIDGKILMLELPITLLDQCQIQRQIQIEGIQFIQKKYGRIVKSSPFRMNADDLPNFMKGVQQNKVQNQANNSTLISLSSEDYIASHFTLKIQLEQSHYENILNCFISKHNSYPKIYQMNIIFDSSNEQNQNFAKVMVQLLAFLLCQ